MNNEKEHLKKALLLLTDSAYYPIFFKLHFPNFLICTLPTNSEILKIEKTEPDAIIIDDKTCKESIFTLCNELKNAPKLKQKPLLVISNALKTHYLETLSEKGVHQIIQEPIDAKLLKIDIEKLFHPSSIEMKLNYLSSKITDFPEAEDIRLRPFFNKNLLAPFMIALNEKKRASILAIDIDYNEIHEYTERDLTKVIKKVFPKNTPLISLGRGKYLIFLNDANLETAYFLGETLRDVVINTLHIGIKIGITSQKKPPYANIREMILAAKMALLEAQKKGTSLEIH